MKDLKRILAGIRQTREPAGRRQVADQTWNVLVQVLLPLVFVLAFVIITSIVAYRSAYEGMRRMMERDEGLTSSELHQALIDLQRQRLLMALEEVKHRELERLGLSHFATPARVRRVRLEVVDDDFRVLCTTAQALLVDPHPGGSYSMQIYQQVLARARLQDATGVQVLRHPEGETGVDEYAKDLHLEVVTRNRIHIHNLILDFVDGLQERVVGLQVGVLKLQFDELLASPPEDWREIQLMVPQESMRRLLDPHTEESNRQAHARIIYNTFLRGVRARLDESGYPFMEQTWARLVAAAGG